jgi:hypothetical protein
VLVGEQIDDLPFGFVAPLQADDAGASTALAARGVHHG